MGCAILPAMTKDDAIAHYVTQTALAQALGIDQSTVSTWRTVPELHQLRLEALTRGVLRAGPECDKYRVPVRRK